LAAHPQELDRDVRKIFLSSMAPTIAEGLEKEK
jgi:hypothetical protein